jgi:preprotein translocase subunit SecE
MQKFGRFFVEVKEEMSKVTWSSRDELIHSTWIVLAVMLLLAAFIGLIDLVISNFLRLLLR